MAASDMEDDHSRSPSSDDSGDEQEPEGDMTQNSRPRENGGAQNGPSKITNAKDPLRPRRKKARRACYACQRAHLTCGDERPCQRCIKRGLADACQDGVRKKAKYLHDAPNEALMPGAGLELFKNARHQSASDASPEAQHIHQHDPYQVVPSFSPFPSNGQMAPPMLQEQSASSAPYAHRSPSAQRYSVGGGAPVATPLPQVPNNISPMPAGWNGTLFDPSDPALFNFDLASMQFGSHYGALEFGMLGHMATGAGETPPSDTATQKGSVGFSNGMNQFSAPARSFSETSMPNQPYAYGDTMISDWSKNQGLYGQQMQDRNDWPNAFAIESNVPHFTSPDTDQFNSDMFKFEDSPTQSQHPFKQSLLSPGNPNDQNQSNGSTNHRPPVQISTPQLKARSQLPVKPGKRPRDPSSIYTQVTSPHPYTSGFHSVIAYLQKRFASSPAKTLTIAKSLASIRPSFIATTKTLNRDDLVFMEKCFQRTLWEYEGFIEGVGTPTIVARRTGEIAAVGKEFEILTGWTKKVLLGRAPNLNVNRGRSSGTSSSGPGSGANTSTGRLTGVNTPIRSGFDRDASEQRPQPVFLAELLDDDSVVTFYEDFARLAFGDSRGSVMGRAKLLKYMTKDEEMDMNLKREAEAREDQRDHFPKNNTYDSKTAPNSKRQSVGVVGKQTVEMKKEGIAGERGMQKLGSLDGKVDCTFCWTVKRDVFDIPMLIVMNFLPCI